MKQLEQEKKDNSLKNKNNYSYQDSGTTNASKSRDMQDVITIEKIDLVSKPKTVRSGTGKGLNLKKY